MYFDTQYKAIHIGTMNLSNAALNIEFRINGNLAAAPAPFTQLFTVDGFTGDASNINITNAGFTTVYTATDGPSGVSISGSQLIVNLVQAVKLLPAVDFAAPGTSAQSVMQGQVGLLRSIQSFTGKAASLFKGENAMQHKLAPLTPGKTDGKFDSVIENMAKEDCRSVTERKGNFSGWIAPFYQTLNNTQTLGFTEQQHGMMVGLTQYLGTSKSRIHYMGGVGTSKNTLKSDAENRTNGRYILLGANYIHNFMGHGEISTHLHGIAIYKTQYRKNAPRGLAPSIATADFKEHGVSLSSEANYVFKLPEKVSVRPSVGFQAGVTHRSQFEEKGVIKHYAQKFKTNITRGGEVFAGLGLRKKWIGDALEGTITGIYEIGMKSGNGKTRTQASTVARPNTIANISGKEPGNFTQYISLLGSIAQKNNWRLIPSIVGTFQKNQNSFLVALKAEYSF